MLFTVHAQKTREAAMAAMWAWFLDWSKTARTVVKNRNYLVMLGLASRGGSGGKGPENGAGGGAGDSPAGNAPKKNPSSDKKTHG